MGDPVLAFISVATRVWLILASFNLANVIGELRIFTLNQSRPSPIRDDNLRNKLAAINKIAASVEGFTTFVEANFVNFTLWLAFCLIALR